LNFSWLLGDWLSLVANLSRALGGLDLESFFRTPDQTGWTMAGDGVYVLGRGYSQFTPSNP